MVCEAVPIAVLCPSWVPAQQWTETILTIKARDESAFALQRHGEMQPWQEVVQAFESVSDLSLHKALPAVLTVVEVLRSLFAPELPPLM